MTAKPSRRALARRKEDWGELGPAMKARRTPRKELCELPARSAGEPIPEFGAAMRALHPRWQRAVVALFVNNGNRTAALRAAGYQGKAESLHVMGCRIFGDN